MSRKDEYVEKLKAQLDDWSGDLDALEAKARELDVHLRSKYDKELTLLKTKRDEAKARLAEVQGKAGDAWLELKKGADDAWEDIKFALAEARRKFKE